MMRFAWIIVALAAIASAVVHLRVQQTRARSQICRLAGERLKLRRRLWDQQLRLGELKAPDHILRLAEDWPLEVVGHGLSETPQRQVVRRR